MELTKARRRELLWLASICDEDGKIPSDKLIERQTGITEEKQKDIKLRYAGLKELGYVDSVLIVWGSRVVSARLNEDGRDKAEDILSEELSADIIPKETKQKIGELLLSNTVALAFQLAIRYLPPM